MEYLAVKNAQGDIEAFLNESGEKVVEYAYSPLGECLKVTGSMAETLEYYNVLRYKGYEYDQNTMLYYLKARWYDPRVGRFTRAG